LVVPCRELVFQNGDLLRIFTPEVDEENLVWHRDKTKRTISVMESGRWKLQMDNRQPFELEKGMVYDIPKMVYHRLIKGQHDLVLRIKNL
tara:strand:+ start:65 stop:334 length:270 start_codon:yes stop_codon:yes gene_type:complete